MKGMFSRWCGRMLVLLIPLVMLVVGRNTARAAERVSSDYLGSGGSTVGVGVDDGQTGDPLDSNDTGGGDIDETRYEDYKTTIDFTPLSPVFRGRRVILVPVFQGGILTFRIQLIGQPIRSAGG